MSEQSAKSCRGWWIITGILTAVLVLGAAERAWHGLRASLALGSAVHYTPALAVRFVEHWHTNGGWPSPGDLGNRGLIYVRSQSQPNGKRIDRYRMINGFADYHLMPDGWLLVFHVEEDASYMDRN